MAENFNQHLSEKREGNSPNKFENPYVKQYEQEQLAVLEENAPLLSSPVDREINKKAIVFIVLAGLGLTGLGAFAYQQLRETDESPYAARAQVVTVPDLPAPEVSRQGEPAIPLADIKAELPTTFSNESVNLVSDSTHQPIQITQSPPSVNYAPIQHPLENMANEGVSFFVQDGDAESHSKGGEVGISSAVKYMYNKDKLLIQGTYLRCILETKIVSDISGFTSCIITEPVYSASGRYVLLPKGSKVMGQYGSSNPTSGRLGVVWDRVVTPDGVDVTLKSPGVDNLGAAGHIGQFESHWASRLSSALLISMISDVFKYAAAEYGPGGKTEVTSTATITNPYESETADTLKRLAISQLERNNSRPNTVTINQGSLINIYTARDIDFSTVIQ